MTKPKTNFKTFYKNYFKPLEKKQRQKEANKVIMNASTFHKILENNKRNGLEKPLEEILGMPVIIDPNADGIYLINIENPLNTQRMKLPKIEWELFKPLINLRTITQLAADLTISLAKAGKSFLEFTRIFCPSCG